MPLSQAASDDFVELSDENAERIGVKDNDWLKVTSCRGRAKVPSRIGGVEPGHLFIPFHFGYGDNPGRTRAANEMTLLD